MSSLIVIAVIAVAFLGGTAAGIIGYSIYKKRK